MGTENAPHTDLLGDPWSPLKDARGRKRHRRTPQIAENIAVLRACGAKVEEIAARVGLSEPTLRKYYFRELDDGPQLARAVLIEAMWKKALGGNVSAARYIREEFPRGDQEAFMRKVRNPEASPVLGKKDAAAVAAQTAGQDTAWGDDLSPPRVN